MILQNIAQRGVGLASVLAAAVLVSTPVYDSALDGAIAEA